MSTDRDRRDEAANGIRLVEDMRGWDYLDKVATPQVYQKNAFRVTGVHTTVSLREAKKAVKKRVQARKLGLASGAHLGPLPVKRRSSDADSLGEAVKRLADPSERLVDGLFWFWPESQQDSYAGDQAIDALTRNERDEADRIWRRLEARQ